VSESPAAFDCPRETWNARYAGDAYIFGTAPNAFLVTQRDLFRAGDRVLAVADGEGRNGVWLAEQGCRVLSLDISPNAVAKARKLAGRHGVAVEFEEADLLAWRWPGAEFDAIVCVFIQFAAPEERAVLFGGFWEALKPGGVLIMEGFGVKQLQYHSGGPGRIEHLYSEGMLRKAFREWRIELLREYEAPLDEGPKHQGMAALVDLVARKPR
jgi:SAM-dependent methyltransferase